MHHIALSSASEKLQESSYMKGLLFFSFGTRGERGDMTNKADKLMKTLLNTTTIVIILDRWSMDDARLIGSATMMMT